MTGSIFITGASGFIGKNFLDKLRHDKYDKIFCLTRNPNNLATEFADIKNLEFVESDILNAEIYEDALQKCDVVIHFAALTGKQKPDDYFKINAEGTQLLVNKCKQVGVRNFVYISTISAKFEDKNRYYYAQSKLEGEEIVKQSGLCYVIIRPTQVIGQHGAVWEGFSRLGKSPIAIIFGNGDAEIQPIYVDDLADCIIEILTERKFESEVLELGGPERISIEDFVRRIHNFYHNKNARVIHLPLKFIIPVLAFLEGFARDLLPVTVGQLSAFKNDGTIRDNSTFKNFRQRMKNIDEIIRLSAASE